MKHPALWWLFERSIARLSRHDPTQSSRNLFIFDWYIFFRLVETLDHEGTQPALNLWWVWRSKSNMVLPFSHHKAAVYPWESWSKFLVAGCPSSHQPTRIREETLESGGPLQRKLSFRLRTHFPPPYPYVLNKYFLQR